MRDETAIIRAARRCIVCHRPIWWHEAKEAWVHRGGNIYFIAYSARDPIAHAATPGRLQRDMRAELLKAAIRWSEDARRYGMTEKDEAMPV